jgi:integrase
LSFVDKQATFSKVRRKASITFHPTGSRRRRWQVTVRDMKGCRLSRFFLTQAEAEAYAEARNREIRALGLRALELPDTLRHEAMKAEELLRPFGKGILDAARFYCDHLEQTQKSAEITDLVERFLQDKELDRISQAHLRDLRSRLRRFAAHFKGRRVNQILAAEINDWLRLSSFTPANQLNFYRAVQNLFNYAIRRQLLIENPIKYVPKVRTPEGEIEIYAPEEMEALLIHAAPDIVPYLAIGAFAGLRSAELQRLEWKAVDLQSGYITVTADIAKTASRRIVPIASNLREWLLPEANRYPEVLPKHLRNTFRTLARQACSKAGMRWKNNALRHSFGSYRMAQNKNAHTTADDMGNSPGVVHRHYRQPVTPEQAEKYWSIRPQQPESEKVIAMPAAA